MQKPKAECKDRNRSTKKPLVTDQGLSFLSLLFLSLSLLFFFFNSKHHIINHPDIHLIWRRWNLSQHALPITHGENCSCSQNYKERYQLYQNHSGRWEWETETDWKPAAYTFVVEVRADYYYTSRSQAALRWEFSRFLFIHETPLRVHQMCFMGFLPY